MFKYEDSHKIENMLSLFSIVIILSFIFISHTNNIKSMYTVYGNSMYPTYNSGDRIAIDYKIGKDNINKEDIIVFDSVNGEDELYIKRVVGTKGDLVEIKNNNLYVNGVSKQDSSIESNSEYFIHYSKYKLEEGEFFVIGDNYDDSKDSRHYGVIVDSNIIGKVKE